MKSTPYRFYKFVPPSDAPFENGVFQWPTIVREFIHPIIEGEPDLLFWFCNHLPLEFQFCYASNDHERIDEKIRNFVFAKNFRIIRPPQEDEKLETSHLGKRWLPDGKTGDEDFETE